MVLLCISSDQTKGYLEGRGCSIELREGKGRCLISNLARKAGNEVLINKAFCSILLPFLWGERCNGCFKRPETPLLRCSGCRLQYYCSKACQKKEWRNQDHGGHKKECPHLPTLIRMFTLLDGAEQSTASGNVTDALLACRVLRSCVANGWTSGCLSTGATAEGCCCVGDTNSATPTTVTTTLDSRFNSSNGKAGINGARGDGGGGGSGGDVLESSWADVMDMTYRLEEESPEVVDFYKMIAHVVVESAPALMADGTTIDDLLRMMARFRSNNFGILNDILSLTGAGVFPGAALLNHSCAPNTVLMYDSNDRLVIRCLRDVIAGEELCHSFADVALPTSLRQKYLKATYGFDCTCTRCVDGLIVNGIDVDKICMQDAADVPPDDDNDSVADAKGIVSRTGRPWSSRRSTREASLIMADKLEEAAKLEDDPVKELEYLRQAIAIREETMGECHISCYTLHGQVLTCCLLGGNLAAAAVYCGKLVRWLDLVLAHTPNHPILGLQIYTLADLYAQLEKERGGGREIGNNEGNVEPTCCVKKEGSAADSGKRTENGKGLGDDDGLMVVMGSAHEMYSRAVDILTISHGRNSELVKSLETLLLSS